MAQNFPLKQIDPKTKTGIKLAEDLVNFSETFRTMMSGETRPEDLETGLWLRIKSGDNAEVVYSDATSDIPIFEIKNGESEVRLSNSVLLSSDRGDGVGLDLNGLTNVDGATPETGNSLVYADNKWTKKTLALGDAADVDVEDAAEGNSLVYVNDKWTKKTLALGDAADVDVEDAAEGNSLVYVDDKWTKKTLALGDASDVAAADPKVGDILTYTQAGWAKTSHQLTPVGTINAFAGDCADPDKIPDGWFLCNGASFDKEDYPLLEEVLGSTTLPNLQGQFIRGYDPEGQIDPDGVTRGLRSEQADEFKSHKHDIEIDWASDYNKGESASNGIRAEAKPRNNGKRVTGDIQYSGGDETRPRNIALNYIIKHD